MILEAPHLSENTRPYLHKGDAERIARIREEQWISYPAAEAILTDLEELLAYPSRNRMPCRLLIAESNNGKSSLLRKFLKSHPGDPNIGGDAVSIPVLFTSLNGPDARILCRQLLGRLFEQIPNNPKPGDLLEQLINVLLRVKPKMILLDEANTLISGTPKKTRECFDALKHITNMTGIPIVAAGTIEALNGFKSDEQMENRFEPVRLPKWTRKPLRTLLAGFEKRIPLKNPSGLPDLAADILGQSGGLIGEIATLLTKSATYAIKVGSEQINLETLQNCGYKSPSQRRGLI